MLRFIQNASLPIRVEFVASLLMLQLKQFFGRGTENGAQGAARNFQSQFPLNNFLNRRHTRQEVLRKYSGTGKRILFKKCRKLRR
jgi:hypothetical protein